MSLYPLLRPLIFALDAENAHTLSVAALRAGLLPSAPAPDPRLRQRVLGLEFANPVGLAAGYDKNGEVIAAGAALGFGFAEIGTVTPRAQAGNPRPRLFRLDADRAVINRLGFNNDGFDAVHHRLRSRPRGFVLGVNVGANRDSVDRAADYAAGVLRFADAADYIALNVSSPNTAGLRDLQEERALTDLLARVETARRTAARSVPVLLKIAPDLDEGALARLVDVAFANGIDGLIVSNTTLGRDGLRGVQSTETGGLSGRPLFHRSTVMLAKARRLAGETAVIIGVGGIDSVDSAWQKIAAGANLVQLYTGMVFEGPRLAARIAAGLAQRLDHERVGRIGDLVGRDTAQWSQLKP